MKKIRIGHLTTSYHTAFILMGTRWIEQRIGVEPEWKRAGPAGPVLLLSIHSSHKCLDHSVLMIQVNVDNLADPLHSLAED
jgi:hypothetical protein